jgi:hypothetical protein
MAGTSKAESSLEDHREKSRKVEGDQVLWVYVGVIGGVIQAGWIAAGSNNGEFTLSDTGAEIMTGHVLWSEPDSMVDSEHGLQWEGLQLVRRWRADR